MPPSQGVSYWHFFDTCVSSVVTVLDLTVGLLCALWGCSVHRGAALCTMGLFSALWGCSLHCEAAFCTVGLPSVLWLFSLSCRDLSFSLVSKGRPLTFLKDTHNAWNLLIAGLYNPQRMFREISPCQLWKIGVDFCFSLQSKYSIGQRSLTRAGCVRLSFGMMSSQACDNSTLARHNNHTQKHGHGLLQRLSLSYFCLQHFFCLIRNISKGPRAKPQVLASLALSALLLAYWQSLLKVKLITSF